MAEIKKFLNQEGVSTLWGRVAEELILVDNKAKANTEAIDAVKERISTHFCPLFTTHTGDLGFPDFFSSFFLFSLKQKREEKGTV